MKFFLDEEFIEDGKTIDLVSIGIVCQDGAEIYFESNEFDESKASDWVKEHVLNQLGDKGARLPKALIAHFVQDWVSKHTPPDEKVEFVGYYSDYDWVCLCQLFGTMMDLPKGWPMYCFDLKQFADSLGNPQLPEQGKGEHNALADARWNKVAYNFLLFYGHEKFQELAPARVAWRHPSASERAR